MKVMKDMEREMKKKTGNAVEFRWFPGAIKGDEKAVVRQMKMDAVDCAGFAGLGMGQITGDIRVLDLPFLLRSDEEVDYVYDRMFDHFAAIFEREGFVLLGLSEVGFVHILSKTPVRSAEDMKKTKCWTWADDPIAEATLKAFGVSPIPLSLVDVLVSLQTGQIDTVYSPPLGVIAMQWFTKVKYFNEYPVTHSTGGLVMTRKAFDGIRIKEHQGLLRDAARKHTKRLVTLTRKENRAAVEELRKAGLEFIPKPGEAEQKQYERIGEQVRQELAGKVYSKEILEKVLSTLSTLRESK
jgi:TRAP-type C4-dicarboxylate transport system substrate-binding protein